MSLIHFIACLFCVSGTYLEWHFLYMQNQYMHFLWDNEFRYLPEHSTVKPTSFCWTSVPRWIQIASGKYQHIYTVKPLSNDHVDSQTKSFVKLNLVLKETQKMQNCDFCLKYIIIVYLKHWQDNTEATVRKNIQSRNLWTVTSCKEQLYQLTGETPDLPQGTGELYHLKSIIQTHRYFIISNMLF